MISRRVAASIGIIGASVLLVGPAVSSASASDGRTLRFTNQIDAGGLQRLDVGPVGPSVGDQFFVASHVVSGDVTGTINASCQIVTMLGKGVKQCEVDFQLAKGTITTRGLTDNPQTLVTLVVTGGTGRYAGAQGSGTLTPTATGSTVELTIGD